MGGAIHAFGSCTDQVEKSEDHTSTGIHLSLFLDCSSNGISCSCYCVFLVAVDCVPLNYEAKQTLPFLGRSSQDLTVKMRKVTDTENWYQKWGCCRNEPDDTMYRPSQLVCEMDV